MSGSNGKRNRGRVPYVCLRTHGILPTKSTTAGATPCPHFAALVAAPYGIPVVSERRFLEWIGKAVPDSLNRTYSAGQIATLSKLSHGTIEELVRFGLLNPRGGLLGFRDLANARQVSNLF